ncbi:hypothetical protein B1A99_27680 [Cohnella sp. CIP 111063]|nr:hypothetical protein B1A99_27680 [Cohnella sp. CIP 111063]
MLHLGMYHMFERTVEQKDQLHYVSECFDAMRRTKDQRSTDFSESGTVSPPHAALCIAAVLLAWGSFSLIGRRQKGDEQ